MTPARGTPHEFEMPDAEPGYWLAARRPLNILVFLLPLVVAYELCTGRRCFRAPGEFALINRVAEGRYDKPSVVRPDFPSDLEAIIVFVRGP